MKKTPRSRSRQFYRSQKVIDLDVAREERKARRTAQQEEAKKKPQGRVEAKKKSKRRKAKARRRSLIFGAIFAIIFFMLGAAIWNAVQIKAEENRAMARLEALELLRDSLKEELSRVNSPEYIEEKARTELHMIMPGEILYIVQENSINNVESKGGTEGGQEGGNGN